MSYCGIINCKSRLYRDNVKFFRIPSILTFKHKVELNELSIKRREKWIELINRNDLTEEKLKILRVCSKHFLLGKPADLSDVDNPDWVPSLFLGCYSVASDNQSEETINHMETSDCQANVEVAGPSFKQAAETHFEQAAGPSYDQDVGSSYIQEETIVPACEKYSQTNITAEDFSAMMFSLESTKSLQKKLNSMTLSFESFRGDDVKTKYYTGLNSFKKLEIVIQYTEKYIPCHFNTSISVKQQIILTLMKLRLNSDFLDLAYRFNIAPSTASSYFKTVVHVLYERFKNLLIWPDRKCLHKTMPSCFKDAFGDKVSVIIDCFEIYIEKPSNLLKSAQCWSNYKHHHTLKYLIGITPQGTVCFVSEAWGGRASDKHITINSKFLDNIIPGDLILADRGFLIGDYVQILNAQVKMPVFTKGKKQLHPTEIEETRAIANVRIHVERIIGAIKQKYRILADDMPISLISCGDDDPILDKIVTICCAIINLCPPIVPLD